ncbi:MAG: EscU/YscU/HrcU family type III secretion system export apparatus switch protein [Sandaracinus sp.]|nr:EscU/YscU/HrcU family type III secretion system export apparatus switch protein [Sandaracinus sp.]MCB9632466.1 EscU/YscU/HrcU family type III secretion system export apparatus switch protein [Sandaracinus sp.]
MSDDSQKTEEATPQRQQKLREEGKFARSQDLGAAAVVGATSVALAFAASSIARGAEGMARRSFRLVDRETPLRAVESFGDALGSALLPVLGVASVAAAAAGVAQVGLRFDTKQLLPKAERFDVLSKLKQVLPGKESLGEIGKQLLKVTAMGLVVWKVTESALPELLVLPQSQAQTASLTAARIAGRVAFAGVVAFSVLAAFDFFLAKRKFAERSKMSRKEVLDEHKESEGDPQIKGRRRARARELAQQRAIADVREATVLVVNPTHIACALRYVPGRDDAPMLLAKGVDETALRMRAEARAAGVPVVEHRPFARALHRSGKVGRPIPVELFGLAAEIIAHVLRLGGAR